MSRLTGLQLRALLQIAQSPRRREERTITEVKAELAARAVAGTPDWRPREGPA